MGLLSSESGKRSYSAKSPYSNLRAEELTESLLQKVYKYPFLCRKKCLAGLGSSGRRE